jgi:hypothetical protein
MPQNQVQATQEEQDAYRLLYDQIHAPIFFEKLAEWGIEPQSEEEMATLLRMGGNLMRSQVLDQQKQASARGSFIMKAAADLDAALADSGVTPVGSADGLIKASAYRVAQDENARRAAIIYQDYLARAQAG